MTRWLLMLMPMTVTAAPVFGPVPGPSQPVTNVSVMQPPGTAQPFSVFDTSALYEPEDTNFSGTIQFQWTPTDWTELSGYRLIRMATNGAVLESYAVPVRTNFYTLLASDETNRWFSFVLRGTNSSGINTLPSNTVTVTTNDIARSTMQLPPPEAIEISWGTNRNVTLWQSGSVTGQWSIRTNLTGSSVIVPDNPKTNLFFKVETTNGPALTLMAKPLQYSPP